MIVYHPAEGETLDTIVENTAEIVTSEEDRDPPSVKFPEGSVIYLDDIRTFWRLQQLPRKPAPSSFTLG